MNLRKMILIGATALATIGAMQAASAAVYGDPYARGRVIHQTYERGYFGHARTNPGPGHEPNGSGWTMNSEYGNPDRW
jgi:hypothetical protein